MPKETGMSSLWIGRDISVIIQKSETKKIKKIKKSFLFDHPENKWKRVFFIYAVSFKSYIKFLKEWILSSFLIKDGKDFLSFYWILIHRDADTHTQKKR